jgi:hypothetical protein
LERIVLFSIIEVAIIVRGIKLAMLGFKKGARAIGAR